MNEKNKFFTQVQIPSPAFQIAYDDELLFLGSCFSEYIGKKFEQAFFRALQNPFGILYNPASIASCLEIINSNKIFTAADLFHYQDLWHSALHHGSFSDISVEKCLEKINSSLILARQKIPTSTILMITFGTAWIYEKDGKVVGNCHKLPAEQFTRRCLSVDEIVAMYEKLISKQNKPDTLKFIFTVSPVRHWADGAHENQLSKSTLLLAINEICKNNVQCAYFPSYEIMLDELRDYRFYAEDLLHPNAVAIDYIWQRFAQTYFSRETQQAQAELEQLQRDMHHRPLHSETPAFQKFQQQLEQKTEKMRKRFPWI